MERCNDCGELLSEASHCVNINCSTARSVATRTAARSTAKAGAVATLDEPRAFTSAGRVD